jgi:hypothetical protein
MHDILDMTMSESVKQDKAKMILQHLSDYQRPTGCARLHQLGCAACARRRNVGCRCGADAAELITLAL